MNEGQIDIDQSALTGESLPVTMGVRGEPTMGSIVTRGVSLPRRGSFYCFSIVDCNSSLSRNSRKVFLDGGVRSRSK